MLRARAAAAFIVNVISGEARFARDRRFGTCGRWNLSVVDANVIGCMSRERTLWLHGQLTEIARATGAHVVSMDADETPELFGADSFHLNAAGHRAVFNQIWRIYRDRPCEAPQAPHARHSAERGAGVLCALGDELQPLVIPAGTRGFERTNLAGEKRVPKIGWEARAPGSTLSLCAPLPAEERAAKQHAFKSRIMPHPKDRVRLPLNAEAPYRISIGFQISHPRNLPLFGVAHVECEGACACRCPAHAVRTTAPGNATTITTTTAVGSAYGAYGAASPPAQRAVLGLDNAGGVEAAAPSWCEFDTLTNSSSLVTVVTYLTLDVLDRSPPTPTPSTPTAAPEGGDAAAAAGCPIDACIVRVRNAAPSPRDSSDSSPAVDAGGEASGEGRHRVVVRALIVGLNDWRTAFLREDRMARSAMMKDVRLRRDR